MLKLPGVAEAMCLDREISECFVWCVYVCVCTCVCLLCVCLISCVCACMCVCVHACVRVCMYSLSIDGKNTLLFIVQTKTSLTYLMLNQLAEICSSNIAARHPHLKCCMEFLNAVVRPSYTCVILCCCMCRLLLLYACVLVYSWALLILQILRKIVKTQL